MKKKAKTKPKKSPQAALWAIKKPKAKTPPAFMPDEVAVLLEGDRGATGFLMVTGWSISPSKTWAKSRLETNFDRLCRDWESEIGKGWRLEIR